MSGKISTKAKRDGRLGIKDLRMFNLTLIGKWWGRLANEHARLWKKVLSAKYDNYRGNWSSWVREVSRSGSRWWKNIRSINWLLDERVDWQKCGLKVNLEDGKNVSLWFDEWIR